MTRSPHPRRLPSAYWRLAWASGVNAIGEGIFLAVIPLLAVAVSGDARLVGAVSAATYLPWLLLSLPVGAWIDRVDRTRLMWRSQAVQSILLVIVAVLVALDRIDVLALAALGFAIGTCQVIVGNATQAIVPDIVARPDLHAANGYQQSIVTVGQQFVGPPLGAFLFTITVALPFGVEAGALALAAALLATMPPTAARSPLVRRSLRSSVADGLHWLRGHRLLRALAVLLGVNTFCFHLGFATLVLLTTDTLRLDPRGYGLLLACAASGGVLGGVVGPHVVSRIGALRAMLIGLMVNTAVFVGIGLSPDPVTLTTLLAVNGFATTLWNVVTVSVRQEIVPASMLGRVNSIYRMIGRGLIPLGALIGGLVAHHLGFRAPFVIAGGIRAVALAIAAPVVVRAWRGR